MFQFDKNIQHQRRISWSQLESVWVRLFYFKGTARTARVRWRAGYSGPAWRTGTSGSSVTPGGERRSLFWTVRSWKQPDLIWNVSSAGAGSAYGSRNGFKNRTAAHAEWSQGKNRPAQQQGRLWWLWFEMKNIRSCFLILDLLGLQWGSCLVCC